MKWWNFISIVIIKVWRLQTTHIFVLSNTTNVRRKGKFRVKFGSIFFRHHRYFLHSVIIYTLNTFFNTFMYILRFSRLQMFYAFPCERIPYWVTSYDEFHSTVWSKSTGKYSTTYRWVVIWFLISIIPSIPTLANVQLHWPINYWVFYSTFLMHLVHLQINSEYSLPYHSSEFPYSDDVSDCFS